jgi:ABC-type glutathione transport system ATPase component
VSRQPRISRQRPPALVEREQAVPEARAADRVVARPADRLVDASRTSSTMRAGSFSPGYLRCAGSRSCASASKTCARTEDVPTSMARTRGTGRTLTADGRADRIQPRKELGGDPLFDGVSFKVERRDRVALSGPNGAGKTTLLRALVGETSLQGGELAFQKGTRVALHDQRPPLERG